MTVAPTGPDAPAVPSRPGGTTPGPLLTDLLVGQARRTPGAVAVRQWDDRLRYRELLGGALALARELRRRGVGVETRIGICCRRTLRLPVAVLGVLLSGGAYVPLDPAHPRRRLQTIMADAGVSIVVADDTGRERVGGSDAELIAVDPGPAPPEQAATAAPPGWRVPPEAAAYVMYTSGSTGTPKGVAVSHRAAAAFVRATGRHFALDGGCRSISFAALGFDVSVLDLLTPLAHGGCAQLVGDGDRTDAARLQRFLEAHDVTWGFIPPALLPLLEPARLPHLRDLVTAGEPPGPEQVARWSSGARRFHNWYGPTETTVCVVGTQLRGVWDRAVPIGRALEGCGVHVLDERLRPRPPGVPGELYIGGPQLARGYLGLPARTAERFVPDPFSAEPGARMYATGDRAVRDADGTITFLGRADRQVKIHGQRVEIGEIEAALRGHPDVAQAVVDVPPRRNELIAYVTPRSAPDAARLQGYCAERLPRYMVPARTIHLDVLPLNASGKVDVAALRLLRPATTAPATRPLTASEQRVAACWARVLDGPLPDPDTDFFDAGGHSLPAMRLAAALRAELQRDIAVADVLAARTMAALAERIAHAAPLDAGDTVTTGHPPALSPAQTRLWFVEQLAPGTAAHSIATAERLRGPLDATALRTALRAAVARHDVLRYRIPAGPGVPSVVVEPDDDIPLHVDDLSHLPSSTRDAALRAALVGHAATPFDLSTGPLLRARLLRLAPDEHVLALTVHHIAFDGWSQAVLGRDLARAYSAAINGRALHLDPLPAGYGDYVAWQRRAASERSQRQLAWWAAHLAGATTTLDLPRDHDRPSIQRFHGAARTADLGDSATGAVRTLARRLDTTPAVVLLAAFGQVLHRLSGLDDLIVGTPLADRQHVAFEPLVGLCLRILPLRLRVADDDTFAAYVRRAAAELADATVNSDVPLERIVEALRVPRDLMRNPLIQVLFNAYDFARAHITLPGCTSEPVQAGLPGSLFDLTLYVSDHEGQMSLQVVFNPELYSAERIDALLDSYARVVADLVEHPDLPVHTARLGPPRSSRPALPVWQGAGVVEQVLRRADATPTAPAVTGAGGALTYGGVERLRRHVSAALRGFGPGPDMTVAVLATRHAHLPALLLGVLSAGARWAVLDTSLPPAVLARQAAAADTRLLLRCPDAQVPASLAHLPVIDVGDRSDGDAPDPPPLGMRGYLAFTSGTTAEPKVVVTPEAPLAHFLDWYTHAFALRATDRFALLSGLAHDPLLRDAFVPLALGAQLCVPAADVLRDPARLLAWLDAQRITVAHLTPHHARLLTGAAAGTRLPALRLVGLSGDELRARDVAELHALAPTARIVNLYGTTETPQAHAYHEVSTTTGAGQAVPVGRGIRSSELLVLDAAGRTAGVGELGDVVVRSPHLAAGLRDKDLTRGRFAVTPGGHGPDDRMYRTGDRGRYLPDGAVVLAGRVDDQVKIRGYRVELSEVTAVLSEHALVRSAAAVADGADGRAVLRGYAVPADPGLDVQTLVEHARAHLPAYAVPAEIHLIPAIPLTPNGKPDRARLPRPAARPDLASHEELSGRSERLVAEVWRTVLGARRIGATDNFFDVGGNSLAIVTVRARLSERIGRDVPLVDLFRFPSVRSLARHLGDDEHNPGLVAAARRVTARRARTRRTRLSAAPPPPSQEVAQHDPE